MISNGDFERAVVSKQAETVISIAQWPQGSYFERAVASKARPSGHFERQVAPRAGSKGYFEHQVAPGAGSKGHFERRGAPKQA